ncbi:hypothetical protein LTR85_010935 [Meristemomyces frigidus]|nr:hypothetical protein LTR85_010935 [Meristemomyces frigidus]
MDWQSSMGVYQHQDEEMQEEDNEDFYGNGTANIEDTKPGAPEQLDASDSLLNSIMTSNEQPNAEETAAEERKAENRRKADLLRAKLIAQRQNTPIKAISRPETPSRIPVAPVQPSNMINEEESEQPSSDALGLESLLAEGRAAAAKAAQQKAATALNGPTIKAPVPDPIPQSVPKPATDIQNIVQPTPITTENNARPNVLSDPYYADLPAWLELTGYHDLAFRTSKLRTYKERKSLEEEAARINERLEKLRREEQAEMEALRSVTAHISSSQQGAPPPLPQTMPSADTAAMAAVANKVMNGTNGVKRPHSPQPSERINRRREDATPGFRIRGANDSPTDARPPTARRQTPPPLSIERRISYPEARRRSLDAPRSRDPSLERRQAYYKRDGERPPPPSNGFSNPRYEQYPPRDARETPRTYNRDNRGSNAPYSASRPAYNRDYQQGSYRGSAGLDLPKGGVRYFMIKSWNHDNVLTAQRDGLWATQTKNSDLLADAFRSARHVILLFSVNKSMAFQGYALMTSPPDPTLPKPPFCAKLNWGTSPAFTLRWLAVTPVHFRMVGHLKNTCNVDERGEPRAVLVGKDGQEISSDAGMGVVWVLDEAEALERGGS